MADKSRSKTADKPKSKITDWCALVAAREIVEGVNISRAHWFSKPVKHLRRPSVLHPDIPAGNPQKC